MISIFSLKSNKNVYHKVVYWATQNISSEVILPSMRMVVQLTQDLRSSDVLSMYLMLLFMENYKFIIDYFIHLSLVKYS